LPIITDIGVNMYAISKNLIKKLGLKIEKNNKIKVVSLKEE